MISRKLIVNGLAAGAFSLVGFGSLAGALASNAFASGSTYQMYDTGTGLPLYVGVTGTYSGASAVTDLTATQKSLVPSGDSAYVLSTDKAGGPAAATPPTGLTAMVETYPTNGTPGGNAGAISYGNSSSTSATGPSGTVSSTSQDGITNTATGTGQAGASVIAYVPASETLTAGTLHWNTVGSVGFSTIQLNGQDHVGTATNSLDLTDATGSHAGWNVQLAAPALTNGIDTLPNADVIGNTALATDNAGTPIPGGFFAASATAPVGLANTAEVVAYDTDGAGTGNFSLDYAQPVNANDSAGTYTGTWVYTLTQSPATITSQALNVNGSGSPTSAQITSSPSGLPN